MAVNYTFTPHTAGQTIQPGDVNELQDAAADLNARLAVAEAGGAGLQAASQTLGPAAASYTIDAKAGRVVILPVLTQATTLNPPINAALGMQLVIVATQDGTGTPRPLLFSGATGGFRNNVAPAFGANLTTIYTFAFDGTNWTLASPPYRLDQLGAPLTAVDLNSQQLTRVGTPSAATDGATKGYVDTGDTAAKARANHTGTQLASTISDLASAINTTILAGSGVTKTYDSTAKTLTLSASGGGGGGSRQEYLVAAVNASARSKAAADYVCDGTADNVEIQAAVDALGTLGGIVRLSEGQFTIAAQINCARDSIVIEGVHAADGDSPSGTRIVPASGFANNTAAISFLYSGGTRPTAAGVVRNIYFYGANVGTGIRGLNFQSYRGVVEHCFFAAWSGDGLRVAGVGTWDAYDTYVNFVQSWNNGGEGLRWEGSDGHIVGCILFSNAGNGFRLIGSSTQIVNTHCYSNTKAGILLDNDGARSKIVNCKLEGNNGGIVIDATTTGPYDVQVVNCGFQSNNQTGQTHSHIETLGTAWIGNLLIMGNTFGNYLSGTGSDIDVIHAIDFSGANVRRPVLLGNTFSGASDPSVATMQASVSLNGAYNPIVRDNNGYLTEAAGTSTQTPGAVTTVTIPHGLARTPNQFAVTPANTNARGLAQPMITVDGTNITLTFAAALAASTSYSWNWFANRI